MNNISKIKEALQNNTQLQQYFIQALIDFENKGGECDYCRGIFW